MNYTISFRHGAMPGHPIDVPAGKRLVADMPAGCVLRCSVDGGVSWSVAAGVDVDVAVDSKYRIDCDTYTGPVTAVLTITPA